MQNVFYDNTTIKQPFHSTSSAGSLCWSKSSTWICKVGQLIQLQSINIIFFFFFSGNQSGHHITIQGDVRLGKEEAEDTTSGTYHLPHISSPLPRHANTHKPNTQRHAHIPTRIHTCTYAHSGFSCASKSWCIWNCLWKKESKWKASSFVYLFIKDATLTWSIHVWVFSQWDSLWHT